MSHAPVHPHFPHATRSPLKKKVLESPKYAEISRTAPSLTSSSNAFLGKCLAPPGILHSPRNLRGKGLSTPCSTHAERADQRVGAPFYQDPGASHSLDGRVPFSSRQVFWLTDQPTHHPFPARSTPCQWSSWLSSPFTAAGPRRTFTVFPFKPSLHPVPETILCQRADDTPHHL